MTAPAAGMPRTAAGAPVAAGRMSKTYFEGGLRKTSRISVPVDDFGQIAGKGWQCRKCVTPLWTALAVKGTPVCPEHDRQMRPLSLRRPPLLPYRELWDVCEKPLRAVWGGLGVTAAGVAVDAGHVPALTVAGAAPLAAAGAAWWFRRDRTAKALRKGDLELGDDVYGKRLRQAIDRAARAVGYGTATAGLWLTTAAGLGLNPDTIGGRASWTLLPVLWLAPAATWWRKVRRERAPMVRVEEPEPPTPAETDEQRIQRIWQTTIGAHAGDVIGTATDGATPIKAEKGRLAGTKLVGWKQIRGGWSATIVGPPGMYESANYLQARGKVASTFSVGEPMVALTPDPEDANRCGVCVQQASVIKELEVWSGPSSVNAETGQGPVARYIDGSLARYELYRRGWGCPHEVFIGTTGSAKSTTLETVFAIGRWAHHNGQGLVADFLIDPQQGQSFGTFADDLAAPIASTLPEAMMLARAFRREMLRRNKYLARKAWTDERGRTRKGVKWWDPLMEGPMLFLTIDEAHEFLAVREFAALITAGARMFRKCGMKLRISTHTPLLSDLGGSMALRDMLTGGFVWCGRTANGLSGPTAFNGRLPADPKTIPEIPGAAYILSAIEKRPMLSRAMCGPLNAQGQPDLYDYVRDGDNNPIGYPGALSAETLAAFGTEYTDWLQFMDSDQAEEGLWTPPAADAKPLQVDKGADATDLEYLHTMVLWIIEQAEKPLDMNALDEALHRADIQANVLAVRQVLKTLAGQGKVESKGGRHGLSERARAERDAKLAEAKEQVEHLLEKEDQEAA